ncbi:hypothetical protein [Chondromyces crocatus]|uniref:Uncharacterized protein n=1 Tax=Chondromyces crocatus TaxID=52 RepID=A0A0K1EG28_CHOCO|nr:hypothetical protein [Chondromyces crocatus]AKT39538.1 uncharacterized protein CMC5_036850 [Chondromyces crocatus]
MQRDAAEKIASIALECSQRIDESVHYVAEQNEGVAKAYKPVAGRISGYLFTEVLAPIWNEHDELAPDWYRNQKHATKPGKPRIRIEVRDRLLSVLGEVDAAIRTTISIAESGCDEEGAARYRASIGNIADYVSIARTYIESLKLE